MVVAVARSDACRGSRRILLPGSVLESQSVLCLAGSFASTADHEVPRSLEPHVQKVYASPTPLNILEARSLNGSAHERRKPRECSGQQAWN